MSEEFPTPAAARPRHWPRVLLAVSLFFNLLVIGAIAGAHLRDGRDAGRTPPVDRAAMHGTGLVPFFEAMPREARGQIGTALRARGEAARPDRAALEAEFATILAALRAEPFERAALEAVMTAQQARVSARVEAGRGALLDVLAGMSQAERAAFADRMEQRIARADRMR